MTVTVAPKDYIGVTAAVSPLPADAVYWSDSKTFGKYEIINTTKHINIEPRLKKNTVIPL